MSTITTLNAADTGSVSRPVINTNFSNLNTDKVEADSVDTLTNKTINTASNTIVVVASDVSDFDAEVANNSAVAANTSKVTNATHTGDVTGSTALTIGAGKVTEAMQILADNATNDVSSSKHGYAPKGDGTTTKFLNANGAYSTPAGGAPEGTAVLSTGESVGKVLQADGDNTSSWVTLPGGGDALVANPLSQFAATTSLQLKGVMSDESGSGALVFGTSPTLVTPALGTPSALVGTNISGTASGLTAGAVSTITGLAPDTATTQATQAAITTCANLATVGTVTTGDVDAVVTDASDTAKGKVELATTAETNTGTDATRAVTPDGLADSKFGTTSLVSSINFVIDGGEAEITTGIKGDIEIPFSCTINQVTLLADQSGSIVVDIWKDTYANFPPTDADTITASAVPTISTAVKSQDGTLTGWTTSITAGDILRFNVDSVTTCERVTLSLKITRS